MKKWLTRRLMLVGVLGVLFVVFNMTATFGDSPPSSSFGSHATITVQNTSTTTDFKGIVPIEMQPQNLIQGGFVNAEMSDILFTDQNATEVGGIGQNISQNGQPFFWYGDIPKQNSKQVKLYTFNALPATHKFPLGGLLTDDITVADSASLNIDNNLTVEAEITLKEAPSGTQEIAYKQGEYRLYLDNGVLKADVDSTAITEIYETQNLVPDVSPLYNNNNPQNNIQEGRIQKDNTTSCQAWANISNGWGANWLYLDQNNSNTQTNNLLYKWNYIFNKELQADHLLYRGMPTLPRKAPWSDVINGMDVAGVYNHGSPTVSQDTGLGNAYYGQELIEMVNDPEGHTTLDNFVDFNLIWWGRNQAGLFMPDSVSQTQWWWDGANGIGNWAWGSDGVMGDDELHNPWNDSDQQSQEWYDLHYPSQYISTQQGIQANNNTQFTDGGSYANALLHSSLWEGWEQNLAGLPQNVNPLYDSQTLGRHTDTLFFDETTYPAPMDSYGGVGYTTLVSWWDYSRNYMTTSTPSSPYGNWYGCHWNSRFTDFDETGLQNIKIFGLKTHLIMQMHGSNQQQDYIDIRWRPDDEVQPHMYNNFGQTSFNFYGTVGAGHWLYSGPLQNGQSFEGDYYHWGEPVDYYGQNTYITFTHPTTDPAHPKFGQTMNVPSNYGWRNCYGYIGSSCASTGFHTVEDVNHISQDIYWGSGSGYGSKVKPTAHWIEIRYFAEKLTVNSETVVGSTTLQKDIKYDVKLTYQDPDVKLYINGQEVGSGTLGGTLTDTANAIVFGESINGWIDDIKISSGSISSPVTALDLQFEPSHNTNTQVGDVSNSWVYTGTIADQSGNSNTGTYNLTSDTTDITTTVGGLVVADEAPPSGTDAGVKNQVGLLPVEVFLTPQAIQESPITQGLHDASTVGTMPQDAWWLLLATIIATVAGAKLMNYLPSLTVVAVAGGVVFAFIILFAGLTLWFLAFYALWAMGTISIHQYWKA